MIKFSQNENDDLLVCKNNDSFVLQIFFDDVQNDVQFHQFSTIDCEFAGFKSVCLLSTNMKNSFEIEEIEMIINTFILLSILLFFMQMTKWPSLFNKISWRIMIFFAIKMMMIWKIFHHEIIKKWNATF